ncbi:two-partner secretion domain-containing protein [Mastigocoleus testarum]|uniref:Filamentous haemagglutinin FhaB/tRNA nuclease CdiA-like TPS domain-containing protein n=1 Tax=Mastigocoleus testarum BC008 TaxID=371196 RepID=A0A0V7ZH29_9CYAN|nr:filamentous hemagglutinin N-terminal domain-containing protein [Mastigocoleus testarum]KST63838.1 hypothetical protein BC008_15395 [Mastigocoleus testarum BC008]
MLSKSWVFLCCQFWLYFLLNLIFVERVKAQIVPDTTLNSEISIVNSIDEFNERINGGALRGTNLFHSFKEFNVGEGKGVVFANPDGINNIFSRVTGNNPSNILGKLGVSGTANLFLINPNGIVFGENASLDVQGSFVATTADAIRFGEGGLFSAREPQPVSQLLTVNPSALLFNQIADRSINPINVQGSFSLPTGQNLLLVGGNVMIEGGNLIVPAGRIDIGSVLGSGVVNLNQTEQEWILDYDSIENFGNIQLSELAFVSASSARGGKIQVQGQQLILNDGSIITTGADLPNDGGEISIRTTDSIIVDNSVIGSLAVESSGSIGNLNIETKKLDIKGGFFPFGGLISTTTLGENKAGDINIKAEIVSLRNGGEISASTDAGGDTGNIMINASESVEVIGSNKNDFSFFEGLLGNIPDNLLSKIAIQVRENASGSGGNLLINTKRLTVKDGAQVQAGTFSEVMTGKGGTLSINASESVEISGTENGSPSGLFTATNGGADANDLTINTDKLRILNGGTISASTAGLFGEGKAGNLTINATDSVEVAGFLKEDEDSIFFSSLVTETGRSLSTITGINPAPGGNLIVNTGKLNITNGGRVSSATNFLAGQAGDITINATESIEVSGEQSLLTTKTNGTGDAGKLKINTRKLMVREKAEVSTSTGFANNALRIRTGGKGGDLDIEAYDFVEVSGVDTGIVSFSILSTGDAGKVKINTKKLFIRNGGTVSTSSIGQGRGGDLEINASDSTEISGSGITFVGNLPFTEELSLEQTTRESSLSSLAISPKDAGDITINTGKLFVRDGGEITANTLGRGKGGDVQIKGNSVLLENRASISSNSALQESGAGNILIDVRKNLLVNNSDISTTATRSFGGAISITAKNIQLFSDSDIRTNVFSGTGGGGNINLTANTIIALGDSDIFSFADRGQGGDIIFNTSGFFSSSQFRPVSASINLNQLEGNNRVDINASGAISGNITGIPDTTFIQNSLNELPENQIDTGALIANSCIVRAEDSGSTFLITGSGGFPHSPGNADISNYSTGKVRSVNNNQKSPPWKKGDPIIEPQGVFRLPNGKLLLSRKCN